MCAKLCWCLLLVCMLLYVIRSQDNGHQSYHQNTRGLELGCTVRRRTRPLWVFQRVYKTSWWKGNFLFKAGAVSESVTCNHLVTLGGFQLQPSIRLKHSVGLYRFKLGIFSKGWWKPQLQWSRAHVHEVWERAFDDGCLDKTAGNEGQHNQIDLSLQIICSRLRSTGEWAESKFGRKMNKDNKAWNSVHFTEATS